MRVATGGIRSGRSSGSSNSGGTSRREWEWEAQAALSIIPFEQSRRLFPSAITSPSIYSLPPVLGVPHLFSSSIVPSLSIRSCSSPFHPSAPRRAASLAAYRRHRRFFFFFDCWLPGRYWRWLPTRSRVTDPSMRPTEYSGELAIYLIGPEPLRDSLGETSSLSCRESARTAGSPRYGTGNRFLPGNDRYVMFLILWCTGVSRRISSTVEDLLEPKDKWFLYNNSRPWSVHWQYTYIVH